MDLEHLRRVVGSTGDGPEPEAPGPRSRIGKYEIVKELARGGMGIVYRAFDPDLRRPVAVKLLKEGDDPQHAVRLHKEARAAAGLRHPNIVGIHDVGVEGDSHYIVMDLIEGPTLRLAMAEKLSVRDGVEMLEQVARAVHYAHTQGVIHRDLKPDNVLIDRTGRPIVTDFGLARMEGTTRITSSGMLMGTPIYMPPEQVLGQRSAIGPRSDVYAMGVMLYELLTGRTPFIGSTPEEVLMRIVTDDPPRPSSLRAGIDRDLETIALKAMANEPERRYATAEDLAADLRRWLRGEAIAARPVSAFARLRRRLRRHRMVAALTAAILAAAALGGYFAWAARLAQLKLAATVQNFESMADRLIDRFDYVLLSPPGPLDSQRAELERFAEQLLAFYREHPDAHEALIYVGKIHAKLDRFEMAERSMTDGLDRLGPRASGKHYLERALVRAAMLMNGQYHRGYVSNQAWKKRFHDLTRSVQADLDAAHRRGLDVSNTWALYAAAVGQFVRQDTAACRATCDKLLGDRTLSPPFRADVLRLKGSAWLMDSRHDQAAAAFDAAAEIKRSDASALIAAAYGRLSAPGDGPRVGIVAAEHALAVDPSTVDAWIVLSMLWGNVASHEAVLGRDAGPAFREAQRACDRAVALDARRPGVLTARASLNLKRARWLIDTHDRSGGRDALDAAVADAEAALALAPDDSTALQKRANALRTIAEVQDATAALATIDRAIADYDRLVDPARDEYTLLVDRAIAHRWRAYLLREARRDPKEAWQRALEDFDRAIVIDPEATDAHHFRGLVLIARGVHEALKGSRDTRDFEAAEAAFSETLRLDASRVTALMDRGQARLHRHDVTRDPELLRLATDDLLRAIELAPRLALAHAWLGTARHIAQDFRGAVTAYERAFELDATLRSEWGEDCEQCRRRLQP